MSEPFRLNQVLGHARLKEEAQAAELSALDAEHRRSTSMLKRLREQEAAQLAALADATRAGAFDPATTETARRYLARLEDLITEQLGQVAAVAARLEASRVELLAIAREKRLLEKLEERHDENVSADEARRERVRSDELTSQRHQRMQRRPTSGAQEEVA